MALFFSKAMVRWLTVLMLTCCLAILTPAEAVQADMLVELQTSPNARQPGAFLQPRAPGCTISVTNSGDLVVRYKEVSLTMAYTLNETSAPFPSAQHDPLHHLEPPTTSGVSLALAIAF